MSQHLTKDDMVSYLTRLQALQRMCFGRKETLRIDTYHVDNNSFGGVITVYFYKGDKIEDWYSFIETSMTKAEARENYITIMNKLKKEGWL